MMYYSGLWIIAIATFCRCIAVQKDEADKSEGPQITIGPTDHKVKDGGVVNFLCLATGSPTPVIEWYQVGRRNPLRSPQHLVTNNGSVLRIGLATRQNAGQYECRAKNRVSTTSATANLTLYSENAAPAGFPKIIVDPKTTSAELGFNTVLDCTATGTPGVNISWLKNYIPIISHHPRIKILPSGSLQIIDAEESDNGKYECVAANDVGIVYSYSAALHVRARRVSPHFTIRPEGVEVAPGMNASLTCVAIGSPMPFVKWRLGARELTPEENISVGKNVLVLINITKSDNYTCVASSDLGTIEAHAEIKVQALPKAPEEVRFSEVTTNSVRLYWTSSNHDPEETYVIQYRKKLENNNPYDELVDITAVDKLISGLDAFTAYELHVLSANSVGRSLPSEKIEITTKESSPGTAPQHVRARPVGYDTVIVQWEEPSKPNGIILGYKVHYTLTPDVSLSLWLVQSVNNTHRTTLTNLAVNRTYTIFVTAFTAVDVGPGSSHLKVLTQPGVPEQPSNIVATALSDSSVNVSWKSPETPSDSITGFEVYYSAATVEQSISSSKNFCLLRNLAANTVYSVRVAAKSSVGEGASSAAVEVKTFESAPSGAPQNVVDQPADSTSTMLRIRWSPPTRDRQNGVITSYELYYAVSVSNRCSRDALHGAESINVTEQSFNITGLRKWTLYCVWVRASTGAGYGPPSEGLLVRTGEDLPGPPKKKKVPTATLR